MILGLVDHDSYVGDIGKSPWNFQHFNVNSVGLQVNANFIPHAPFKPKYDGVPKIAREYLSLFLALGKSGMMQDDNEILQLDYVGGNALYAFILSPDMCLSGHAQPARLAPIAIEIGFEKAIPKPLQLLALCVYDTKFEVTKNRNVILDPTQSAN